MAYNAKILALWLTATVAAGVLTYNPVYLLALLMTLAWTAASQKINYRQTIRAGLAFGLLPLFVNVLFVHKGSTVLLEIPNKIQLSEIQIPLFLIGGPITLESTAFGLIMAVLIMDMLLAFAIFSALVPPESILRITPPLLSSSSLLMSIALRFTPVVSDDMQSIRDAQRSRGLALSSGSLISRLSKHSALIIPAVVSSLERSFNLAESMACRSYNKNRTTYKTESLQKSDYLPLLALAASIVMLALSAASGILDYWPYRSLVPQVNIIPVIAIALFAIPMVSNEADN
ncbi:MAG: energy-coupling factor transporter transmembrane component T [Candidatus Altiarchaeota archaeon]|nr:energy-coupling factor transporter transmembrane component T [Candidatus Altiarchaeota archaeon]